MSRQLYVPHVGATLELAEPWTFNLYDERRNDALIAQACSEDEQVAQDLQQRREEARRVRRYYDGLRLVCPYTFPVGTVLRIDRLYVRRGDQAAYDSLSFVVVGAQKRVRFWAKLADCNKITFR